MRRRYGYDNDEQQQQISLEDFEYANKDGIIVPIERLQAIKNELETAPNNSQIFFTEEHLAKAKMGLIFVHQISTNTEKPITFNYVFLTTYKFELDVTKYNKTKHVEHDIFFGFVPSKQAADFIENVRITESFQIDKFVYIETFDEYIEFIFGQPQLNEYIVYSDNGQDDAVTTLQLLEPSLNIPKINSYDIYKKDASSYTYLQQLNHIYHVKEVRKDNVNYRIAFTVNLFYYSAIRAYNIFVISEKSKYYNLIDKDRLFLRMNDSMHFTFFNLDILELNANNNIIIRYDAMKSIYDNLHNLIASNSLVIDNQIYEFYKSKYGTANIKGSITDEKLNMRYIQLLDTGKEIKINDMILSKSKIALINDDFSMEFKEDFIDVCENFGTIRKLLTSNDRYNFNIVYEKLLELSAVNILRRYNVRDEAFKQFRLAEFKLNTMNIKIERNNNMIYINNVFSRIEDVYYLLTKAICYSNAFEYERYMRDVSHIGIFWKTLISNGKTMKITNHYAKLIKIIKSLNLDADNTPNDIQIRFSFLWDPVRRTRIYLNLNNHKYLIKNKIKFRSNFEKPYSSLSVYKLKKMLLDSVEGLDDKDLFKLIDNAVDEYKIIIQRAKELVELTIKDVQANETTIDLNGHTIQGYVLEGLKTHSKYFITSKTLEVYKWVNGSWNRRCVVDDHNKERIFEDRLANRLINVYNEPLKIHTLHNI